MKRIVVSIFSICLSLNISAQASGGQIRRSKPTAKVTTKSPSINKEAVIRNLIRNMVYVQGGTFAMGATEEQGGKSWVRDAKPLHNVSLNSFYIGKYEVTQEEWLAVMNNNPSEFKGSKRPVENVSWKQCQEFIERLNVLTGRYFRLPTEAEWEYSAIGAHYKRSFMLSGSNLPYDIAWYRYNSDGSTHNVGQKDPNELGIYDMSGNVWELCQDWYGSYNSASQINPKGPSSGYYRVIRGGGYDTSDDDCSVLHRGLMNPLEESNNIGLRLVLDVE